MFEITKSLNPRRVLIRELHIEHQEKIRAHFKDLGNEDRLLRFGMHTSDEMIDKYVNSINFNRDTIFGVFDNSLNLIGCAHLGYPNSNAADNSTAEFGVSVSEGGRDKGVGSALFKRAAIHAQNTNIKIFYTHYLARNKVMMHIAKKAGMSIEFSFGEADAYLTLMPSSNKSMITEAVQAQVADIDYALKKNISESKNLLLNIFSLATNK